VPRGLSGHTHTATRHRAKTSKMSCSRRGFRWSGRAASDAGCRCVAKMATRSPITIEPDTFSDNVAYGKAVPSKRAKARLKPCRREAPLPPPITQSDSPSIHSPCLRAKKNRRAADRFLPPCCAVGVISPLRAVLGGTPSPSTCQTTGGAKQGQQDDVRVLALSLSIRPLSAMLASLAKAGDTATR